MKMRINHIEASSYVDGPGERTVLFAQGCPIHCPGCQSRHTWEPSGGHVEEVEDVSLSLAMLASRHGSVTLSGGEVFAQPAALAELVWRLKRNRVHHILVYTGYTWENLTNPMHPAYPYLKDIFENIDVLVDGPFIARQDDPYISWRGSRNQRPIDVPESLSQGRVVMLDWEEPRLTIGADGAIYLPAGLSADFAPLGNSAPTRMCGQSR